MLKLAERVAPERQETNCRIECAAGEIQKRGLPLRSIAARIAAVWWRDNRLRVQRKRKSEARKCDDGE